jgi:putative radical SAM enzyme (TIGR03279 family)
VRHTASGGRISIVQPGSAAEKAGICPGDVLHAINGHSLRDVIDYRFYSAEEILRLEVSRPGGIPQEVQVVRSYGEDVGLDFQDPTFDGIRRCRNRCDFCFIAQMPPGLRSSLYIRDDDYRYSFLFGSFVTLTNLKESDWRRIGQQGLSPLYVSVHATDWLVRSRLLGQSGASDILGQIRRLGSLGTAVHTQIVITPGHNDGAVLTRTVADLADLYPTVASIGIVPVGLTRYQSSGLRNLTGDEAKTIVDYVASLQSSYRQNLGRSLVYASDELYLAAGRSLPPATRYDDFPQLDNGIGLTRQLLNDWSRVRRRAVPGRWPFRRVTLACGTLIAPTLRTLADQLAERVGASVEVLPVTNELFGPTVTVSGLLTASDVVSAAATRDLGDALVLPRSMFDAGGLVTLDDRTARWIETRVSSPVAVADSMGALLRWANRGGEAPRR